MAPLALVVLVGLLEAAVVDGLGEVRGARDRNLRRNVEVLGDVAGGLGCEAVDGLGVWLPSNHAGPWAQQVGFDQVADAACGMFAIEGTPERAMVPPTGIVNDYLTSWLAATGAMAALYRRITEGGSYRVHVSLTRVALWILSLGVFDKSYARSIAGKAGVHTN